VNMWWAHTVMDSPAIDIEASTNPAYPKIGFRLNTGTRYTS